MRHAQYDSTTLLLAQFVTALRCPSLVSSVESKVDSARAAESAGVTTTDRSRVGPGPPPTPLGPRSERSELADPSEHRDPVAQQQTSGVLSTLCTLIAPAPTRAWALRTHTQPIVPTERPSLRTSCLRRYARRAGNPHHRSRFALPNADAGSDHEALNRGTGPPRCHGGSCGRLSPATLFRHKGPSSNCLQIAQGLANGRGPPRVHRRTGASGAREDRPLRFQQGSTRFQTSGRPPTPPSAISQSVTRAGRGSAVILFGEVGTRANENKGEILELNNNSFRKIEMELSPARRRVS